MINVYGPYPKHLSIEETAVTRSTLFLSGYKLCLKTQLDHFDRFRMITNIINDGWCKIQILTQKELIDKELRYLEGFVNLSDLSSLNNLQKLSIEPNSNKSFYEISKKYEGVIYKWGGKTSCETDCSGLVYQIYREMGKILPRFSDGQFSVCEKIKPQELSPGDLIFGLYCKSTPTPVHVMIYLGDEQIMESCGIPSIYKTHITTFESKWGLPSHRIFSGFQPSDHYQIHFGRPT